MPRSNRRRYDFPLVDARVKEEQWRSTLSICARRTDSLVFDRLTSDWKEVVIQTPSPVGHRCCRIDHSGICCQDGTCHLLHPAGRTRPTTRTWFSWYAPQQQSPRFSSTSSGASCVFSPDLSCPCKAER